MNQRFRATVIAIWLIAMGLCGAVIARTDFVADLSAFMPKVPSERQQLLVEQLRDGIVARLIMLGIEGGTATQRAQASQDLSARLRTDPAFVFIQNGDAKTRDLDRAYFFENRYLLSPGVSAERFSVSGLHDAIHQSIEALSGNAGLLIKQLLPRDPTGEMLQFIAQFSGTSEPRVQNEVWASRDGQRALLLAQLRAAGTDTEAQHQAIEAIRLAFTEISTPEAGLRLVMTGTSVFSVSSRNTIEREVRQLAVASTVFVVMLLLLVYRSAGLLLLGLLPVLSGALAGIASVSLFYGHVHALTLGFGTTLIGEAVDYSIYLFIQRSGTVHSDGFWRTIRLGVLTSVAGFSVLLFSGFPGLSQLGTYSIAGLLGAVLVTRYVLPLLMKQHLVLPNLITISQRLQRLSNQAPRLQWLVIAVLVLAAGSIALKSASVWNRQLSALSPISAAEQQLDHELRSDLGATDMQYFATFTAASDEEALQLAERTGLVFSRLVQGEILGGFNSPAYVLPSLERQRALQSALPQPRESQSRLTLALRDLPIRASRLEGFLQDLEKARTREPLTRADLNGTSAALLYDSLLIKRTSDFLVLMPLRAPVSGPLAGTMSFPRISEALQAAGLSKIVLIDLVEETSNLFENYLREAKMLSGMGLIAIVALLLVSLRSGPRTLRVAVPLVCAVTCVVALLLLSGVQLTIFHLIGLLLVVAVGSNYALFFDGSTYSDMEASGSQMQISLVVANLTTVGSFGILGLSQIPVLKAIGTTVGAGALLALVFSAILARPPTATKRRVD